MQSDSTASHNGHRQNYALLELSAKVEYALLALMELASYRDLNNPLTLNAIAARQPIPERYLEHIFTLLRRGGIVQSQRGARGGYVLSRDPWQITVLEVIALVGSTARENATLRTRKDKETNESVSIERDLVWEVWHQASEASQAVLSRFTIQDLCQKRDIKKQKSQMYYI
jgi:Rrf2 family protein